MENNKLHQSNDITTEPSANTRDIFPKLMVMLENVTLPVTINQSLSFQQTIEYTIHEN